MRHELAGGAVSTGPDANPAEVLSRIERSWCHAPSEAVVERGDRCISVHWPTIHEPTSFVGLFEHVLEAVGDGVSLALETHDGKTKTVQGLDVAKVLRNCQSGDQPVDFVRLQLPTSYLCWYRSEVSETTHLIAMIASSRDDLHYVPKLLEATLPTASPADDAAEITSQAADALERALAATSSS